MRCKLLCLRSLRLLVAPPVLLLGLAKAHAGAQITVAWDPSPDPDVVGYVLYVEQADGSSFQRFPVDNSTQASVTGLTLGVHYIIYATAIDTLGLEGSASASLTYTPAPQPGANVLVNGSFEQDYTGWVQTGHQEIQSGVATSGSQAVCFNYGDTPPNAQLSQTFDTLPGQLYSFTFDYGVYSPNANKSQSLGVKVQGATTLVAQTVDASASGPAIQYRSHYFNFTADSMQTTVAFQDDSQGTGNVDSYLDNVKVSAIAQ